MSSSSNRSTKIPLSFDRFREKSIEFLSPFRNHHYDKHMKQSPDRTWKRKVQVHPHHIQSSKCDQINYDAGYLFHIDQYSNSKTYKNPQIKKRSSNFFYTRAFDIYKTFHPSESDLIEYKCPPTPYMIDYRHSSVPNLVPTCIIKRTKSFDQSIKQSNFDLNENSK